MERIYFSELLPINHPNSWKEIKKVLEKHQQPYSLLKGTKDIWCRDYMPVKNANRALVQFKYEPSYLLKDLHLQSSPSSILKQNHINAKNSILNLDGGNVELINTTAILTERVFKENPSLEKKEIIHQLSNDLACTPYFVKDITTDMTGHIDGYLRIIKEGLVVVNQLDGDLVYIQKSFKRLIKKIKWEYFEMPWFDYKAKDNPIESAIGVYVNFLVLNNFVLFPIFEVEGNKDQEALNIIQKIYPNKIIEPININEIAKLGGLINCISWCD
ncbi:agmatine deiminase family protein [Flammeovirga sp. MY04]|uniref:agmatine deiminase family protein n=1 Tax=Flammeovirga sp. MY04 TaxID=1191459 RepID=UPI0008063BCB|nr:agmatine deiminase family protein [Flammeovirga sp. MY04]ANQ51572.1 agmatine deiminase family protein [Flammeovirga sp. MY04]